MPHPRLRIFDMGELEALSLEEENQLEVVLFQSDIKLRIHVVNHLMNTTEQKGWEAILGFSIVEPLTRCRSALEELDCPFFAMGAASPPCTDCPAQSPCSQVVSPLVDLYVEAVEKVIREAIATPRFARFHDAQDRLHCWMTPDFPLVAKLVRMDPGRHFNVMTCFRPGQGGSTTAKEIHDLIVRQIQNQKRGKVHWVTLETWGMAPYENSES